MSYFSVSTTPEFLLEEVHQKGIATIRFFECSSSKYALFLTTTSVTGSDLSSASAEASDISIDAAEIRRTLHIVAGPYLCPISVFKDGPGLRPKSGYLMTSAHSG